MSNTIQGEKDLTAKVMFNEASFNEFGAISPSQSWVIPLMEKYAAFRVSQIPQQQTDIGNDLAPLFQKLFDEIKHGDQEHQDWLKSKINAFVEANEIQEKPYFIDYGNDGKWVDGEELIKEYNEYLKESSEEMDELRETLKSQTDISGLVEALEEYIEFLVEQYNDVIPIAYIHHYKSSEADVKRGNELREKIAALKSHKGET